MAEDYLAKTTTTHKGCAKALAKRFLKIVVDTNRRVIDHGDIITVGGFLAWVDLGLSLVARILGPVIRAETARFVLADPAAGEARTAYAGLPTRATVALGDKLLGLYGLPPAGGDVIASKDAAIRCRRATHCGNRNSPASVCHQKAEKRRFLDNIRRKYREDYHAHHRVARPCDRERRRNDCLGKEGARSVGLRGRELLMMRPARIVMGTAVFMISPAPGSQLGRCRPSKRRAAPGHGKWT
jgi:hypothetical protein